MYEDDLYPPLESLYDDYAHYDVIGAGKFGQVYRVTCNKTGPPNFYLNKHKYVIFHSCYSPILDNHNPTNLGVLKALMDFPKVSFLRNRNCFNLHFCLFSAPKRILGKSADHTHIFFIYSGRIRNYSWIISVYSLDGCMVVMSTCGLSTRRMVQHG